MPTFRTQMLPSGQVLHYAEQGSGQGRPMIFLHGYADSWFSFSRILPLLPPDLRAIALDLRGHGNSGTADGGFTLEDMVQDVLQFMKTLDLTDATVIGHSMGSFIAQRIALKATGRVACLVLIGSAARSRNDAVLSLAGVVAGLTDPVDTGFIRDFQMSGMHSPIPEEFLERAIAESRKLPARVWQAAIAGLASDTPPLDFTGIRCPVMVVWGNRDSMFSRADQEELAALLPHAYLNVWVDAGHTPHWEDPERFVRELLAFERARLLSMGTPAGLPVSA
ncbi:MAG: alpha/beta hydrolase [Bryobacterales bacterium]|nr:alpha/beta hydrolase [Bryobacterales bacterium]